MSSCFRSAYFILLHTSYALLESAASSRALPLSSMIISLIMYWFVRLIYDPAFSGSQSVRRQLGMQRVQMLSPALDISRGSQYICSFCCHMQWLKIDKFLILPRPPNSLHFTSLHCLQSCSILYCDLQLWLLSCPPDIHRHLACEYLGGWFT